jgi:hypothetical protein
VVDEINRKCGIYGWGEALQNAYMVLAGKLRYRYRFGDLCLLRWEDNTEMDLREIGCEGMDWIVWLSVGSSGGLL